MRGAGSAVGVGCALACRRGCGRGCGGVAVGGVGVVLVALRALPFSALPCLPVAAALVSVSFLVVAVGVMGDRARAVNAQVAC